MSGDWEGKRINEVPAWGCLLKTHDCYKQSGRAMNNDEKQKNRKATTRINWRWVYTAELRSISSSL